MAARNGLYSITLGWLNTLGGWDFFNFVANKTYGEDISDVHEIERDIFKNWPTDFITGNTSRDVISLKSSQTIIVRSQQLTLQQVNAIKNIRRSVKVIDYVNDKTVIVDKGSFQYRTDGEKFYTIEFKITYPGIIIQTQ